MNPVKRVFGSSLGKKYVMAVTGCLLFIFVVGHLIGNLQVFLGADVLNAYGAFLQSKPALIWTARLGLLAMLILHVWAAIQLSAENKRARPAPYMVYTATKASYASRTMLMSGVIIFVFIIYHLLHFTVQTPSINFMGNSTLLPTGSFADLTDPLDRHDVFRMMVIGFSNVWVSGFYILGMALLCLHLSHGLSSMFQSMGWKRRPYGKLLDKVAVVVAALIFAGYSAIPIAVLMGYGRRPL